MKRYFLVNDENKADFLKEVIIMSKVEQLKHPNIVHFKVTIFIIYIVKL